MTLTYTPQQLTIQSSGQQQEGLFTVCRHYCAIIQERRVVCPVLNTALYITVFLLKYALFSSLRDLYFLPILFVCLPLVCLFAFLYALCQTHHFIMATLKMCRTKITSDSEKRGYPEQKTKIESSFLNSPEQFSIWCFILKPFPITNFHKINHFRKFGHVNPISLFPRF